MNEKIDVLDHGLVRLVDFMGSDLSVVRNARVSYVPTCVGAFREEMEKVAAYRNR